MNLFSRELLLVLIAKVVITIGCAVFCLVVLDANAGIASLAGGLISIINVLYYNFRVLRTTHRYGEEVYIRGLLVTQLLKYASSLIFLFVALGVFKLAAVPLITTFLVTQLAYFFSKSK